MPSIFTIKKYQATYKTLWDNFVAEAKNGTFLFCRDFMEYHEDRFIDTSLLVFKADELVALFPANKSESIVYSHQGLTYGGLIFNANFYHHDIQKAFQAISDYFMSNRITQYIIKEIPEIYYQASTYGIKNHMENHMVSIDQNMVLAIDYSKPLSIHKTKRKHYRKADKLNFKIKQSSNFAPFWNSVLKPRLQDKHNTKPLHSLEEITLLNSRFPDRIKQFDVYVEDQILAGITIFETNTVVKSQYGATTNEGEKVRALDYLFLTLIEKYKTEGKLFFSMGTVTDKNRPKGYNEGLLKQKQELGCDLFEQHIYSCELERYVKQNAILE